MESRPSTAIRSSRAEPAGALLNPARLMGDLWRHRDLVWQMALREVTSRYRGSILGGLWFLLQPLLMLLVYTFVFSVVFKARWGERVGDSPSGFALALFAGLLVFNLFAECANRSPTCIVGQPNYVKKVVFPLQVVPMALSGAALFYAVVNTALLLLVALAVNGTLPMTAAAFPLVLAPTLMLSLGMAFFLASLGVYLRDIALVVPVLVQILFFTTPVFYPASAVPEPFRSIIQTNPLSPLLDSARRTLLWNQWPEWGPLLLAWLVAVAVLLLGYAWFQKTRRGFADVL